MAVLPPYTNNGTIVFGRSMRDSLKNDVKLFGKYNRKWNDMGFASRQIIGPCMEMISNAKPATENSWHQYYIDNQMDFDRIELLGAKWAYLTGLADEVALAHVIIHILDETWDGYRREEDVMNWMNRKLGGNMIFRPSYEWDTDYAIDLALREPDSEYGFIEGYQVKPASFFESKSINWHKIKIAKQHVAAEAKGLKPVFLNADDMLIHDTFKPIHHTEVISLRPKRKI